MADIGSLVLHKVIKNKDLAAWSRLKLVFFDSAYTNVFNSLASYYNKYNEIPNFSEIALKLERNAALTNALASLENLEVDEEVDIDVAIDALVDSYTQNEALKLLDKFVDNITLMDSQEIKDSLASAVMILDEKTHTSDSIMTMGDFLLFNTPEDKEYIRFPSGVSNKLDAELGGLYRQEVILLGGKRGAGKSIVCANFTEAQYALGNTSVYFTIEMTGKEIFQRSMSIRSGVSHSMLKQDTLSDEDIFKLVKTRAEMYDDADDLVQEYLEHKDKLKFESDLIKTKNLKRDNQIIIIDDRELSLTSIDLHLGKLKAKFGDKLKLAAIDYLNQIVVPGVSGSMYDWTTQIFVSKKLKEYARKYDLCIMSPYQIDDSGGTRFAKGILDSCDVAFLLDAHEKDDATISFETTKIRGGKPLDFSCGINWDSLKINPVEVDRPAKKSKKIKEEEYKDDPKSDFPKKENPSDTPW